MGFQLALILSGNLAFLNHLTIVPALACFDDSFWCWMARALLPAPLRRRVLPADTTTTTTTTSPASSPAASSKASAAKIAVAESDSTTPTSTLQWAQWYLRQLCVWAVVAVVTYLSFSGPIQNLLSREQVMNSSFDRLHLVNTYGAFGSITKVRHEIILSGSAHPHAPTVSAAEAQWKEYEFACKPGNVTARPCIAAPYHHRLDWQMWFAAFQSPQQNPWLQHVMVRLVTPPPHHNATAQLLSLMHPNPPFDPTKPPVWVKADLYR